MENNNTAKKVVILGDSTIDNRIWLGKEVLHLMVGTQYKRLNALIDFLAWLIPFKPKSVVENLRAQMPNIEFIDQTNDGFTTEDLLEGAYRDKVFGQGAHRFFPHEFFKPLLCKEIEQADSIILSVGGNNFREFIQQALGINNEAKRRQYIETMYPQVFEKTLDNYKKILKQLVSRNPSANIILMTQYYPAINQKTLLNTSIYDFMTELGTILNKGDAQDTIVEVMKDTYNGVIKFINTDPSMAKTRFTILDVTSSLNPHFSENYVGQIEPSNTGGANIAKMLKYCLTENRAKKNIAYRFTPDFFIESPFMNTHIHCSDFHLKSSFNPVHPKNMLKQKYNWKRMATIVICAILSTSLSPFIFSFGTSMLSTALSVLFMGALGSISGRQITRVLGIGYQQVNQGCYAFEHDGPPLNTDKPLEDFGYQAAKGWLPYLKSWLPHHGAYGNESFKQGYKKGLEKNHTPKLKI
ncbi:MAG: hypothetical protein JSS07_06380 [Proteobacteria bacterium]|nr:hypothetical protein [Pseudomonadota bacterium]